MLDTPISETAFIGLGIGAAVEGMRPIVELMFADFFGVAMDQIYNHMAKIHFESGGNVRVPMVLMTAAGGGYSDAEQHSQCLWGTFAHLPGMKVVVPSNPADAKGLMISAIRDDNPVVYMFHKGVMGLPWMAKNARSIAPVPEDPYETPIGKAVDRPHRRRTRPWSPCPCRCTTPWTWPTRCPPSTASNSRSSTCAAWCRWTGRPSSPRWPRPGTCWSSTRTISHSACPARSPPSWPRPIPACSGPRYAGSRCPTSRSLTRAHWNTPCCPPGNGSSAAARELVGA